VSDRIEQRTARPLLEIRDLAVSVPGPRKWAVASVSLSIFPGQTLAIVGESGSGKSMTALSVLRLVPPACSIERGAIEFDGTDLLTLSERAMRRVRGRRISMIFQEPMSALNPVMTVGAQVTEVLRLHLKLNRRQAAERAATGFEEIGLIPGSAKLKCYPHELSGGMRQRVMIAMAVACEPSLLLADEPTTALDVTIQAQILALLKGLQKSRGPLAGSPGMAMMLIAHDLGVVAQHADVVCVMYAGHVVEYTDVLTLFEKPMHPYTRALLQCRPSLHGAAERLGTVEELMRLPEAMVIGSGAETLVPWWPARRPASAVSLNGAGVESMLVEVEPSHWVGCWRTNEAMARGGSAPNVAPRTAHQPVVSISASSAL
jgi:ABC-type dipeptide/oligopeptide/nickel transport system ATPase component